MFQGDKGYCYIPYEYVTNSDYCFDVWTVRQLTTDDFGQEHWDTVDSVDFQQRNNNDDENNNDDNHGIQNIEEDDGGNAK
jgi:C1A family cysteine protease